jgi:hypothetical protein
MERPYVTLGECLYLEARYRSPEVKERVDRLKQEIARLTRKGQQEEQLHRALMFGVFRAEDHVHQQAWRKAHRRWHAAAARTQRALERAAKSLQRLAELGSLPTLDDLPLLADDEAGLQRLAELGSLATPDDEKCVLDAERVSDMRDELIRRARAKTVPPPTRPRGGRPWEGKQAAEAALRQLRVTADDRKALMMAIGFLPDDD